MEYLWNNNKEKVASEPPSIFGEFSTNSKFLKLVCNGPWKQHQWSTEEKRKKWIGPLTELPLFHQSHGHEAEVTGLFKSIFQHLDEALPTVVLSFKSSRSTSMLAQLETALWAPCRMYLILSILAVIWDLKRSESSVIVERRWLFVLGRRLSTVARQRRTQEPLETWPTMIEKIFRCCLFRSLPTKIPKRGWKPRMHAVASSRTHTMPLRHRVITV